MRGLPCAPSVVDARLSEFIGCLFCARYSSLPLPSLFVVVLFVLCCCLSCGAVCLVVLFVFVIVHD